MSRWTTCRVDPPDPADRRAAVMALAARDVAAKARVTARFGPFRTKTKIMTRPAAGVETAALAGPGRFAGDRAVRVVGVPAELEPPEGGH